MPFNLALSVNVFCSTMTELQMADSISWQVLYTQKTTISAD